MASGIPSGFAGATQQINNAVATISAAITAALNTVIARFTRTVAAETAVASANADTALLAANPARKGFAVRNDATTTMYIALGGAASAASYYVVLPGGYYEDVFPTWPGTVRGFWLPGCVGNAVIREST